MSRAGYEHFSQTSGGLKYYLQRGYIPYPLPESESLYGNHRRGAGQTLENSFQDHTLAKLAEALGHTEDAESGFMRPRNIDGSWQSPFDPYLYENGFVESNPAQSTWFVPMI